jgi:hypothetical protein
MFSAGRTRVGRTADRLRRKRSRAKLMPRCGITLVRVMRERSMILSNTTLRNWILAFLIVGTRRVSRWISAGTLLKSWCQTRVAIRRRRSLWIAVPRLRTNWVVLIYSITLRVSLNSLAAGRARGRGRGYWSIQRVMRVVLLRRSCRYFIPLHRA